MAFFFPLVNIFALVISILFDKVFSVVTWREEGERRQAREEEEKFFFNPSMTSDEPWRKKYTMRTKSTTKIESLRAS